MKSLRRFVRRLAASTLGRRDDNRMREELAEHFTLLTEEYVRAGLPLDEARRKARLRLGTLDATMEAYRDEQRLRPLEDVWQDVRYTLRTLRKSPTFAATVILTLALGIGAATAILAAVRPVLFEPLPYPDAARLVTIVETTPAGGARNPGTFGMFVHLAERTRSFDAMAVMFSWQPVLTGVDTAERLDGQRVSADYFRVLRVPPVLGRDLQAEEDRVSGRNVVVLSHALWQRRFAGDPSIIGRTIRLDDRAYAVVGVMPARFENVLAPSADIWTPLQYDLSQGRAWGHHLQTIGRLRLGASVETATEDVQAVGDAVFEELKPETYDPQTRFTVVRLKDDLVRGVTPAFTAVLGAVVLLLAIACVNVTNLLLARSVGRRRELSLRSALGAGRGRLVQQLVTEGVMIAALGGAAGMLLARLVVGLLVSIESANLFRLGAITPAGPVSWWAVAVTTALGVGLGLLSAIHAGGSDLRAELGTGAQRSTGARRPVRRALVVVQVALAVVLLVGSGLLLRSLGRLLAINPGFNPEGVLTVQVQASGRRFATADAASRFFDQALEAIRAISGVAVAGATSQLPLSGDLDEYGAHFEAGPGRPATSYGVFRYAVSPGYLEALDIPLREGRLFDAGDRPNSPRVAVISESLARRRFSGVSPIGARLRVGPKDGAPYTIVGVVGNVRQVTLAARETDAVYTPASQWAFPDLAQSLVIRTSGDPRALVAPIRQAIRSVDKDQPIVRVATMSDLVLATAAGRRFVLMLFQGFALTALVLAATGIYGLLAGSVAERTREIGVRSALGASRRAILSLVVGEGVGLTAVGAAVGLSIGVWGTRFIGTLLFDVSRFDPWTYIAAVGVLSGAAMVACVGPAWRAVRIDPATTLRAE